MPTSNIVAVEIGIPGPQGAGVTPAEKASFVTLTGANTFTNTSTYRKTSVNNTVWEDDSGVDTGRVDTSNKRIELANGAVLHGHSDAYSTETWNIDGATGNAQFDGVLQVDGGQIKGEQLWLGFAADGGGSVLGTGVRLRWLIPYNCQIVSDGSAAWMVGLDQTGSIGLDLWVDTHANYPPTNADRISGTLGSQNPRVSAATKASSATLTGWTINLVKGSWLFIAVDSVSTATWFTLGLHVKKT